ncbi:Transcriptional repressor CTCF [Frankliniella fusca]|uniref:Transcriptional repressor CTCF n=1 Tax=Frankliniella fusca TaxID=407009 RepID=A0AAE1LEU6_9NEOP|nr:Transcriptional repressor CTCF [Frankliniella fusca]
MGVSIEVWRARTGMFCGRASLTSRSREAKNDVASVTATASILASILTILLLIGNIEPNPGPFPCKLPWCTIVPTTISSNVRHQQFHAMDKHFMFTCPACDYGTKSFSALNTHVSLTHRERRHHIADPDHADESLPPLPHNCSVDLCCFSTASFWELVQHLCNNHINEGVTVKCPFVASGACSRDHISFKKASTLRSHLSQYHGGWNDGGCPRKNKSALATENTSTAFDFTTSHEGFDCIMESATTPDQVVDPGLLNDTLLTNNIAKFYLEMYGVFCLPVKTIQEISENISFFTDIMHQRMKIVLSGELKELNIPDDKIRAINVKVFNADLLHATHHKDRPGPSLTSDYLRKQFFKDNFNYMEPIELNLTDDPKSKSRIQLVPITQTLSTLLADPTVQREIESSFLRVPSNSDLVSHYTEGSQFINEDHPVREIHLNLYIDGVNPVMNVLGSAKNKFKTLVMYFTIGNVQAHNNAKVISKHLVALVSESVFKALKGEVCFKSVIDEIDILERDGIQFKGSHVPVCLEFMLGDNLGQHQIGGFWDYFSGDFFCRFCTITKASFRKNPAQTNPPLTEETFNYRAHKANMTETPYKGIEGNCAFNSLKYFHSTKSLCPCIGHDILEGVVSWDLSGILSLFVKKKWFSYKMLNRRIKQFKCDGVDIPNKPAPVNIKGKKLGGHAVQNWMLLRLVPFIIGDKILDFNDPAWQLYLKLKKLCEFFCGHSFLKSDLAYLKFVLIPEYFEQRALTLLDTKKYPLRPKHHYMAHYPDLMLQFGPLIDVWTLGHEQKHKFFKHFCRMNQNFKNIQYSCAIRHQMNLCYLSLGELYPLGSNVTASQPISASPHLNEVAHLLTNFSPNCIDCEAIEVDGSLKYSRRNFLILSSDGPDIIGGFIRVIAMEPNDCYPTFVLEKIKALYDPDRGVYKLPLDGAGELIGVPYNDLPYKQTQPLYKCGSYLAFSLKSKVHQSL